MIYKRFKLRFFFFKGGWTFAFNEYFKLGIPSYMDSLKLYEMAQLVDPYSNNQDE